jgi:hypothetical protein
MHLVELTAMYEEEVKAKEAAPKRRGRPTAKERFIDLLFPNTVKYKSKKGKQLSSLRRGSSFRRGRKAGR